MSRPLGGYIGHDVEPATTAAPGIWTLREAELYQRKAQWPVPFAPDVITGLQLWLDASDASTLYDATTGGSLVASGGGVARWEDKSGNDNHATQSSSSDRPNRTTAQINSLDVLTFDGTSNFLQGSSTPTAGNSRTVCLVGKSDTTAGGEAVQLGIYNGASLRGFLLRQRYIGSDHYVGGDVLSSNLIIAGTQPSITSTFCACIVQASTSSFSYFHNSTSLAVTGSLENFNANPGYLIGKARSSSDVGFWPGKLCEVLVYDSALSDTDREAVENYLLAKWGIS